jgi:hypothetical protein
VLLNPFAKVEAIRGPAGAIDGLRIVAPVKGRGLQTNVLLRADDEAAFVARRRAVLSALLDAEQGRDGWASSVPVQQAFLRQSGLFVEDGECPGDVDPPFLCSTSDYLTPDRGELARRGFVIVHGFFGASTLAPFREYYTQLIDEGFAQYGGEGGEPHRWVLHNDDAGRMLQSSVLPVVQLIAGEALKPSFCYLLRYLEGATLEAHRDRAQCAITAVLQIDFDPPLSGATPWPLHFHTGSGVASASLAVGDLVVFRGTQVEHYRDALTCGRSSTSLACCFVPTDFTGALD